MDGLVILLNENVRALSVGDNPDRNVLIDRLVVEYHHYFSLFVFLSSFIENFNLVGLKIATSCQE